MFGSPADVPGDPWTGIAAISCGHSLDCFGLASRRVETIDIGVLVGPMRVAPNSSGGPVTTAALFGIGKMAKNVLGGDLLVCSSDPMTGFFRTGTCDTCGDDVGMHTVCVVMTQEFLEFSKIAGNDLSTPRPELQFLGLRPGDHWCLCLPRWLEALQAGMAPRIVLQATHMSAIEHVSTETLVEHAVDADAATDLT